MASSCGSALCINNTLDASKVAGKIVACVRGLNGRVEKGGVVKEVGGAGMILVNNAASGDELLADPHLLPATMLTYSDGVKLLSYINNTRLVDPETYLNGHPGLPTSFDQNPLRLFKDFGKNWVR